jgi:hypothetical protein
LPIAHPGANEANSTLEADLEWLSPGWQAIIKKTRPSKK